MTCNTQYFFELEGWEQLWLLTQFRGFWEEKALLGGKKPHNFLKKKTVPGVILKFSSGVWPNVAINSHKKRALLEKP